MLLPHSQQVIYDTAKAPCMIIKIYVIGMCTRIIASHQQVMYRSQSEQSTSKLSRSGNTCHVTLAHAHFSEHKYIPDRQTYPHGALTSVSLGEGSLHIGETHPKSANNFELHTLLCPPAFIWRPWHFALIRQTLNKESKLSLISFVLQPQNHT